MLIIKKKDVFKELAVTLFLMNELVVHPRAAAVMPRLREQASTALESATPYIGILGSKQIREFLEAKPRRFIIECGSDIIAGDTIRFTERVLNHHYSPPRYCGMRAVTADVIAISPSDNPMLLLRVIACGGVWDLEAGADIRRTMKIIKQFDIRRCPWDNEDERRAIKNEAITLLEPVDDTGGPEMMRQVADKMLGRPGKKPAQ